MLQTIEAIIDEKGVLRMIDPVDLPKMRRVLVTILDEEPTSESLSRAIRNQKIVMMEEQHAKGYAKFPSKKDDAGEWESEQEWGKM
jgi:predicted DNA-binding antitoxin AbrB/MazE fold protein